MTVSLCWLMLLLAVCIALLIIHWWCYSPRPEAAVIAATVELRLNPRPPYDCPACRQSAATTTAPASLSVQPWCARKSRRGAPKRILTDWFACPTRTCPYYRITDAHIHALVGDGTHGKTERIQTLRCQACGVTFTTRRHTALYRLKTTSQRIGLVLTALAEGLSIAGASRVFGHTEETITRGVTRAGKHSASLQRRCFQRLHLPHLQLDELRTRLRARTHVLWLWVIVDPLTKLIPVLHLGARTQAAAHHVIHTLRQELAPDCLPVFTSDGLNLYFYALTAHFGSRSEEHTSELQSRQYLVCRLLLEKKKHMSDVHPVTSFLQAIEMLPVEGRTFAPRVAVIAGLPYYVLRFMPLAI